MNFFVYILYSFHYKRTYIGQTDNLNNRLIYHNSGKVRSTKAYKPWILIHSEVFTSSSEALKREKWFKSPTCRKKISEILGNYLLAEGNGLSVQSS